MKKEAIWKIGPTAFKIHSKLSHILRQVEDSQDVYLGNDFMRDIGVRKQDWDLADTDDYFACMTKEEFTKLSPSDPEPDPDLPFVTYEEVEYPESDPPHNVFDLKDCAFRVEIFFKELQMRKASMDGYGTEWPVKASIWVPRQLCKYEDLRGGSRMPPSVPWVLHRAYYNDNKPHQLYHALHGDEGKDGVVSRSELEIMVTCMIGRMASPALCMHNIPVRLVHVSSIFRAIIADAIPDTSALCSRHQCPNYHCLFQPCYMGVRAQMRQIRAI